MFVIVGLGNPGDEYARTRHNAGFLALDTLVSSEEWQKDTTTNALIAQSTLNGEAVVLAKPLTYMNHSGKSVKKLLDRFESTPEKLIVLYDDLDLALGVARISFGRGSGGHNGLASVINQIGSKDFTRIRIGISPTSFFGALKKPKGEDKVSRFVLAQLSRGEEKKLSEVFKQVPEMLEAIVTEGYKKAMNTFN